MSAEKKMDPDGLIDGRLPAFKMREGESTHAFAERLVAALDYYDEQPPRCKCCGQIIRGEP